MLYRREGIAESLYSSWSKDLLEAGKRRLAGDTILSKPNHAGQSSRDVDTELSNQTT